MCSNASVLLIDGMRDGDAVAGAQAALQGLLGCVDGVATQFDRALITTQEELKAQAQKSPKKRKKKKKPGVSEGAYLKIELAPLEALEGTEPVLLPPGRGELPPAGTALRCLVRCTARRARRPRICGRRSSGASTGGGGASSVVLGDPYLSEWTTSPYYRARRRSL